MSLKCNGRLRQHLLLQILQFFLQEHLLLPKSLMVFCKPITRISDRHAETSQKNVCLVGIYGGLVISPFDRPAPDVVQEFYKLVENPFSRRFVLGHG